MITDESQFSSPGDSVKGNSYHFFLLLIAVIAVYAAFAGARVWLHGKDPSFCISASRSYCNPQLVPTPIYIHENESHAYDGLFFYRLALNPWNTERVTMGIHFDHPAYRHQRIGYPLVCWIASLGRPEAVPTVMILVNLFWLGVLAYVCIRWVGDTPTLPAWGLLPLLWPGFLISLGRDLCEIQGTALLLTGCWLMHTNRIPWSVLAFAGAALTRETNALPIAGIGCYYAWKALGEKQVFMGRRYFWFLIPAGVVLAWHAYLRIQYGAWPVFGLVTTKPPWSPIPFQGLISFFFQGFPFEGLTLSKGMGGFSLPATQSLYDVYRCFQLALCLFVTMLGILALRSSRVPGFLVIAWFFTGFVFYGLMDWVWAMGPSSFLRVGAECATIGLLIIAVSKPVIRWLAFFVVGAAWASAFALYLLW